MNRSTLVKFGASNHPFRHRPDPAKKQAPETFRRRVLIVREFDWWARSDSNTRPMVVR